MRVVRLNHCCSQAELDALREPRDDIVAERAAGANAWEQADGPFREYRRELTATRLDQPAAPAHRAAGEDAASTTAEAEPGGPGDPAGNSGRTARWEVRETISYRLAVPVWSLLVEWPVRRALRHRKPAYGYWWAPPDRLDARTATVLSLLCAVQVVDGYLGSVLSQSLTFAADEFGHANTAQGVVLGTVRFGVLIALGALALADRKGRQRMLLASGIGSCVFTVLGGLSPQMWFLGGSQLLARGMSTALGVIIVIVAAEEMPARTRAWAASVLLLAAGLGSGMVVWILPLADLSIYGWRAIYLAAALGVWAMYWAGTRIPETRRYQEHKDDTEALAPRDRRRRTDRLVLLAASAFLVAVFLAPNLSFQNDFLKDERGFTALGVTIFSVVTATPVGIGFLLGGHLAESRGRRGVGAFGLSVGALLRVLAYFSSGPALWLITLIGAIVSAMAVPALAVYGPELFGTHDRGRANGIVVTAGVVGSSVGLLAVGALSDRWGGHLGPPIALTAIGPLIVAVLVLTRFPETAGIELEDLNPEDA